MNEHNENQTQSANPQKLGKWITIGVFLLVVMGMFLATIIKPDREFSDNENRVLAGKPEISLESVFDGSFATAYETYLTDQFVNRDGFIAMKVYAEQALGRKAVNNVYFAPDNYLVEEHKRTEIDDTLVEDNLQRVKKFVEANPSLHVRFMLVPTASNVYPEWLPAHNMEYDQTAVIRKAKAQIGDTAVVDACKALQTHKEDYIFYRTDHHWTSLGAYYGYEAWAKSIGLTPYTLKDFDRQVVTKDFWGTTYSKVNVKKEADEIELFTLSKGPTATMSKKQDGSDAEEGLYDREKLKEKDKYTVFLGGNNPYVEINTSVKNNKTLLVVQDSYAHCLVPFLANHYEKVILLDYRYYNSSTKKLIEKKKVTDALVLYNVINFATDKNIIKINK